MNKKSTLPPDNRRLLEYAIDDYFEIKASLDRVRTKPLKEFLISEGTKELPIYPIEGFLLAESLVVLTSGNGQIPQQVIFVNLNGGKFNVQKLG